MTLHLSDVFGLKPPTSQKIDMIRERCLGRARGWLGMGGSRNQKLHGEEMRNDKSMKGSYQTYRKGVTKGFRPRQVQMGSFAQIYKRFGINATRWGRHYSIWSKGFVPPVEAK